jgi:hypothetical protein
MKTKTFTLVMILALSFAYVNVSATVWRVNATPNSDPDFTTIQAAHDDAAVLAGDTLYLEGSTFSYGALSISKQLTIIGNGYFLGENPDTQHNISPSKISTVYCYAGCEGTKFTGCTFLAPVYIYTNNLTFERNYFDYGNQQIYSQANCSDILILGNYFYSHTSWTNLGFNQTHSNILVANNFFTGTVIVSPNFNGIFANNIFSRPITIYNSTLVNNIAHSTVNLDNCLVTYNIGTGTQFGNQNGNQENVLTADLYVGATGNSTDGQWQLKVGSPAIGAGEEGTDIGIFGGESPYVLSGLPPIPAIYDLDAQSLPTNTLDVTVKAKSHN